MKKGVLIGIILLLFGCCLVVLDVLGFAPFQTVGTASLRGYVVDAETGEPLTVAVNIMQKGKNIPYTAHNGIINATGIPLGYYNISLNIAYYQPYELINYPMLEAKVYDLGTIRLNKLTLSGIAKVEWIKVQRSDNSIVDWANPGESVRLVVRIVNVGTDLGYLYFEVYDGSNIIFDNPFIELNVGEYRLATSRSLTMPNYDWTLRAVYGHKIDIQGTKVQDGEAYFTIYTSNPNPLPEFEFPVSLTMISGVSMICVGITAIVYSHYREAEVRFVRRKS